MLGEVQSDSLVFGYVAKFQGRKAGALARLIICFEENKGMSKICCSLIYNKIV